MAGRVRLALPTDGGGRGDPGAGVAPSAVGRPSADGLGGGGLANARCDCGAHVRDVPVPPLPPCIPSLFSSRAPLGEDELVPSPICAYVGDLNGFALSAGR